MDPIDLMLKILAGSACLLAAGAIPVSTLAHKGEKSMAYANTKGLALLLSR
jgi:hypothetical protein